MVEWNGGMEWWNGMVDFFLNSVVVVVVVVFGVVCYNCCLIVACCLIVNRFATLTVTKNYCYASDICGRREEAQIMKGLGWRHHGEVQVQ